jgi:exo-beta-1,3-glucanase (GH17 family)
MAFACAVLAIAVATLLAPWVGRLWPAALPGPVTATNPLPCLSYAPFRRAGHTPFDPALVVTPEMIEADLALLRPLTDCVRTYGLDHGLDAVPAVAARLGLRVALGAWIGRDPVANEAQVERALELARAHPGVVDRLVIGNEVLLRRELSPEALAALLQRARARSPVPVTYADVWEFWRRHAPVLLPQVDVAAIHVLPYWEDDPVAVDQAVEHVHRIAQEMRQALAPKPIWVAETGWPAAGRARGPAQAGREAQARFVRELLVREAREPIGFNLIEAFDQPWKRRLEGPMGGAWGLFDAQGRLRVPMQGDQPPDPRAPWVLGAALGGVLAGLAAAVVGRRREGMPEQREGTHLIGTWGIALLALAGAWLATLAAQQALTIMQGGRSAVEAVALALAAGVSTAAGIAAAVSLAARDPTRASAAPPDRVTRSPSATPGTTPARRRWMGLQAARALESIPVALLFTAAVLALWTVFDGRYRPLPWAFLAGPALLWGLRWALRWVDQEAGAGHRRLDRPPTPAARALAWVLAAAGPALLWIEGLANLQALATLGALAVLAITVLLWPRAATANGHGGPARSPQRDTACTQPSNATSAAGTASDAL